MYNKNRKRNLIALLSRQNGFMITEVLITMVVIVITLVAITPMFIAGVKTSKVSKNRIVESNIAQREIEKFNQDNFLNVYNRIDNWYKTNDSSNYPTTNWDYFLDGNSYIYSEESYTAFVDGNGKIVLPPSCTGCREVWVTKIYSCNQCDIGGTPVDDTLQLLVKVSLTGAITDGAPVVQTAVLSRDRM